MSAKGKKGSKGPRETPTQKRIREEQEEQQRETMMVNAHLQEMARERMKRQKGIERQEQMYHEEEKKLDSLDDAFRLFDERLESALKGDKEETIAIRKRAEAAGCSPSDSDDDESDESEEEVHSWARKRKARKQKRRRT